MNPALLALLLGAALAQPVRPCLKAGDGPTCGCQVTLVGGYIAAAPRPHLPPCTAAQLAYLQRWLPRIVPTPGWRQRR